MIVDFGYGKCPLCGDFGKEIQQRDFTCRRCDVAFNRFFITANGEQETIENKFWN